jgi:hypothetical protein
VSTGPITPRKEILDDTTFPYKVTDCNAVTNPGAILGKGSLVYPCINAEGGYYPPRTVISTKNDAIRLRVRPVHKGK